jgi:outer membrane protein assembly factor BamB
MGNPEVRAYNPSTGEQLWSVGGMAGEVCPSPCSGDDVIFAANEYAKLMAINGADGSVLWESTDYLPEVASPVYANGRVYIATTYGVLAAFDAKTGELKAERELEMELYGSPMVVDGKIYIIGTSGRVFVFTADDNLTQINKFETGEMTYATPAFLDGKVVIRSLNTLYCVAQ